MSALFPHLGSILAGLAALGTLIFGVWQWRSRSLATARRTWDAAITGKEDIAVILDDVMVSAHADRVLFVAAHNGGAEARAGLPMYLSVIAERTGGVRVPSVQARVQRVDLDPEYARCVLGPLSAVKKHTLRPRDLPEGHWLRDLYAAHNVERAEVCWVWATSVMQWICIVQYADDRKLTPAETDAINYAVERLRRAVRD